MDRPVIWRVAFLRLLLAAVPLWFVLQALLFSTSWVLRSAIVSLVVLTIAALEYGLLAIAVLGTFASMLDRSLTRPPIQASAGQGPPDWISGGQGPPDWIDAFVLAFIGAWLVRASADRPGPRMPLWMIVAAGLMAFAMRSSALRVVRVVEGLALAGAFFYTFRQRPGLAVSLPAALSAAGIAAVAWRMLRARSGDVPLNLVAVSLAAILYLAFGIAARTRAGTRVAWLAVAAAIAFALSFAESLMGLHAGVEVTLPFWFAFALAVGLTISNRMNAATTNVQITRSGI